MRGRRRLVAYGHEYRRTWRGRLLSVLLLVPVSWLSVLLLRVPAGSALTVPALLIDRLVVLSTAVILPVALVLLLVLPVRAARAAAVVGGSVSGIVGLPTALAAVDAPRETWPTALALASVICGLALVAILLSSSLRGRRWRLSLLAPLSLLPIVQFWQATAYTPAQLVTSVTPQMRVVVQQQEAGQRQGVIEVSIANPGDVRASLFTSQLIDCFTTEDDWEIYLQSNDELRADEDCDYAPVVRRNANVDAKTTQTYSIPWQVAADRSFSTLRMVIEYVREDRMRLNYPPSERDGAAGCHGPVTVYRLQPDTRFKGVVQPARLLTFDDNQFYFSYAGAPLCGAGSNDELRTELGYRFIQISRSDWLTDGSPPN